jgi:hypothetical protein
VIVERRVDVEVEVERNRTVLFALIHSPLVGPATWTGVADALESAGHRSEVPDLTGAAGRGDVVALVDAARSGLPAQADVIVGHSGAGPLLPSIARDAPEARLVFVDAGVPPCVGEVEADPEFLAFLHTLAVGGVLPKWSTWWGAGAMQHFVPHEARRREVEVELPQIPLSFYEQSIGSPTDWCAKRIGYLLLSEAYRNDLAVAQLHGWPTRELLGTHLDIVNHPNEVASLLVELAGERPSG